MRFSLALNENKSTTGHAQTFFQSIHMRFSFVPRGNSTSMQTQAFFQWTLCIFLLYHMGKWKHSCIVHALTFCSSPHKLFWDTNMRCDFCSYL